MSSNNLAKYLFLLSILLLGVFFYPDRSKAVGVLDGVKICIDPGHGGTDPGAVNVDYDLKESDINLDVSYGLKSLLESEAGEVVMTRIGDEYLTNSDRYTYCNEQQATILISVHTNSVTDPTWDGSMALYGPRESPDLAKAIYDVMFPFLRDTAPEGIVEFKDFGVDRFASGVLFKSDMPAAMMEPVLMSNPAEAEKLVVPIYADGSFNSETCVDYSCRRGQIAQAIFLGTLTYFNSQSGGAMHIASIDLGYEQKRSNYFIDASVSVYSESDLPVPSAKVTVRVTYPDEDMIYESAITDGDGISNLQFKTRLPGTYYLEVVDVVRDNWFYDRDANIDDTGQLTIPE